jgi:hypothetical protein
VILADASIWIDFFRTRAHRAQLAGLIETNQLCMHPHLVAELALGSLPERRRTLEYLDRLTPLRAVRLADVRHMIEARGLASKGIGLTDAHLLAACLSTPGTRLWTRDEKLGKVAGSLGIRAHLP